MPASLNDLATTAIQDVQETFKRVYLMAVDAVPDLTPLTAQMNRTRKFKAGPDGLYFNAKLETGGKVANVPDGLLLPLPSRPVRRQGVMRIVHTYSVIGVGGQSIPLTEGTRNAFVENLEDQMEDAMTRVKLDVERQYNGDGRGILCTLETVVSAPTYGAQQPHGVTWASVAAAPGTMFLIEGMEVAVMNPVGPAERGRSTITAINTGADTFTLAASVSGAAIGDWVVLANDVGATGTDRSTNANAEPAGVLSVTNTGDTFLGINGASFRRWNGTRFDANGSTISERLISQLEQRAMARSGKKPTLYYTSRGQIIELQDQLAALRRNTGEAKELKGGYAGVTINGRDVLAGDWCPRGGFFALNTEEESVGMVDLVPMGFVDLDGAKLHRLENRHAYRADLWFPHGAIWFNRSAQSLLFNLTDDLTILR